ncbi:SGNH/GDSL hydrolase family protein [Candidatus Nephthysia bennettiae]|uniref:SGNH/GDSL hydrolase family protein n=1 Tax=Candidatus Nephthysia bennettiae TaxID=3127016 RepID=A0A934JVK5_9BACT|nr:SGNH/GDSL hydrolase family protein [Candidatus Dormibacteraeota bacterium]MBJ7612693.1 SGNH/GDSL hydrolase family protein [Candidatus Dormibacteraeota bacterium]
MTARALMAVLVLAALAAGACSQPGSSTSSSTARSSPEPRAIIYAALGASETVGVGTSDPTRQSFPQLLYLRLPRTAVYYNFGLPGETTSAALKDELPAALAVRPTLATVWFNVDDIAAGVGVTDYESRLEQLVGPLSRAGATRVLIANTPPVQRLPAYLACRPDPPPGVKCALGDVTLPPPDQVAALVDAYNAAIARVAARHGATVVDLAAQTATTLDQHPDYLSGDGLHPSAKGAAAIAAAFATSL